MSEIDWKSRALAAEASLETADAELDALAGQIVRELRNTGRRFGRAGNHDKAAAYRYAAQLVAKSLRKPESR